MDKGKLLLGVVLISIIGITIAQLPQNNETAVGTVNIQLDSAAVDCGITSATLRGDSIIYDNWTIVFVSATGKFKGTVTSEELAIPVPNHYNTREKGEFINQYIQNLRENVKSQCVEPIEPPVGTVTGQIVKVGLP